MGQRFKDKRPSSNQTSQESRLTQEYKDAMLLKMLREHWLTGRLSTQARGGLLRLPETWALPMILQWEEELVHRLSHFASTFKEGAPDLQTPQQKKDETVASYLRWYSGVQHKATHGDGLEPRFATRFCAWVPWAADATSTWTAQRESRCRKTSTAKQHGPADKPSTPRSAPNGPRHISSIAAKYPEDPPRLRIYVSSEAELEHQRDAQALHRAARAHFHGVLGQDATQALSSCAWGPTLLKQWEAAKVAGADPDIELQVSRLHDIAKRHPKAPVTQLGGLERNFWGQPEAVRLHRADACWMRRLKDIFMAHSLPEPVLEAMRQIPVWGEPRLKEWEVQKEQMAQQIWAPESRRGRKSSKDSEGNWNEVAGVDQAGEGEDDVTATPECPRTRATLKQMRHGRPANLRLDHTNVLVLTKLLPRKHNMRQRLFACHGKTLGEALRTVLDGVVKLTVGTVRSDIARGFLRIQEADGTCGNKDIDKSTTGNLGMKDPCTPLPPRKRGEAPATVEKKAAKCQKLCETFLGFDGKKVCVTPADRNGKDKEKKLKPFLDLTMTEIGGLSAEALTAYEDELGLSSKRDKDKQLEQLACLTQTLNLEGYRVSGEEVASKEHMVVRAKSLHELSDYERQQLTSHEVRQLGRAFHIGNVAELSVSERQDRLKERIRAMHVQSSQDESDKARELYQRVAARAQEFREMAKRSLEDPIAIEDD